MGAPPDEPGWIFDEEQHPVTLTRDFEIARDEVTQARFEAVMGYNPSLHKTCGGRCPVENVSWHEGAAYCASLSAGKGLARCYDCAGHGTSTKCEVASHYRQAWPEHDPHGLWGDVTGKELWLVGAKGMVHHLDKGAWSSRSSGTQQDLYAVWGDGSKVWIVGQEGTILRAEGQTISAVTSPVKAVLRDVRGCAAGPVWSVGTAGTIVKLQGGAWAKATSPTARDLYAVWCDDEGTAWAAGEAGTVLMAKGGPWQTVPTPVTVDLRDLWGTGGELWVVGDGGTVLHRPSGSSTLKVVASKTTADLHAIWGLGSTSIWIGGMHGALVHFDGAAFTALKPVNNGLISGIWGSSSNDVWAICTLTTYRNRGLLRYDGLTWSEDNVLPKRTIYECPGYRLPTEAEWEYAYRAGTTTALYNGRLSSPSGPDPGADKIAWYKSNSGDRPHPVGQKTANGWGLRDMAGNASEYVHDWFDNYLGSRHVTDPIGRFSPTYGRAIRGGAYDDSPERIRAAQRFFDIGLPIGSSGFRCARTLTKPVPPPDAGAPDAGALDAGALDGGAPDGGAPDH